MADLCVSSAESLGSHTRQLLSIYWFLESLLITSNERNC